LVNIFAYKYGVLTSIDLWYYFECCCLSAGSQVSGTCDVGLPGCWTRGWDESRGESKPVWRSFFCRTE